MHQPARHGAGDHAAEIVEADDQRRRRQREADRIEHRRRPERDRDQIMNTMKNGTQSSTVGMARPSMNRCFTGTPSRAGSGAQQFGTDGDFAGHDRSACAGLRPADVAGEQKTHRFREPNRENDGNGERRDRTDIEHRLPAERGNDPGAGQRTDEAAAGKEANSTVTKTSRRRLGASSAPIARNAGVTPPSPRPAKKR